MRSILKGSVALLSVMIFGIGGAAWAADDSGVSGKFGVIELEGIDVTARRRHERLQETPISLTVIDGNDIGTGRASKIEDIVKRSPNTVYSAQGGPMTIRGVGSLGMDAGLDRQVGIGLFVDDVFVGRSEGFPTYLDDLERVEVVRGNQSTVYGKSTIGGAVNLVTRKPGSVYAVEVEGSLESLASRRFRGAVDAPMLSGDLLTRTFVTYTRRDGYIKNVHDGRRESNVDSFGVRFTSLAFIGDDTTAKFSMDYERNRDDGGIPFAPLATALKRQSDNDYKKSKLDLDHGGVTLKVDHDFGAYELISTTAYRRYNFDRLMDGDFSSTVFAVMGEEQKQWQGTQEVRLVSSERGGPSKAGDLRWMAGAFFMHENFSGSQLWDSVSVPLNNVARNYLDLKSNTYALYANGGIYLTPKIEFSGGLRYTYELKKGQAETKSSPVMGPIFGAPTRDAATRSFNNMSPELGVSYQATPDALTYAKVTRGFKSGGVSQYILPNGKVNVYDSETNWSYEIGAKTTWLDNRLNLNIAGFLVDGKNTHVRVPVGGNRTVIDNAEESRSYGFEAEAVGQLTKNLSLNASYGYLEAQYDKFMASFINADYSGRDLSYAPRHSASAGFNWSRELDSSLALFAGSTYSIQDSYSFFAPVEAYVQKPTHNLDADLGVKSEIWKVSLWAKNLTDETSLKGYFRTSVGIDQGVAAEGRTIGFSLKAEW